MASACAGLLLGLSELLLAAPFAPLPPALGVALVWSSGIVAIAYGSALGIALRLARVRATHPDLVGGLLGPLLAAASIAPALARSRGAWAGVTLLGGGLLLVVGSFTGAALARRIEGERPPLPGIAWAGASLMLAGLAWNLHAGRPCAPWPAQAAIPTGAAVGAIGLLGRRPGGPKPPRTRFGGLLFALAAAASIAPLWPWWLPWLLYDRNLPEVGSWPPNLVFVALEAPAARQEAPSQSGIASLELLHSQAITYAALSPEPWVASLLTLPDGTRLGERLYAEGYVTAAIGAGAGELHDLGVVEVDDRPGGRRLLEESAAWMAGAPLLLGPASSLIVLLGHDRQLRSPEQVAGEAARWILGWRTMRAPAPFLLVVDLRTAEASAQALDAALESILGRVEALELDSVTLFVIAIEERSSGGSGRALRALVVLPSTWPGAAHLEGPPVWGRTLTQALLEIALSDGESPVRLPGLEEELWPPKAPMAVR